MSEARRLTVAHQKPGECAYCDDRHTRIVAAVAHELAEEVRDTPIPGGIDVKYLGTDFNAYLDGQLDAVRLIDPEGD